METKNYHCCDQMGRYLSIGDIPIYYSQKFREYGIEYTDGGTSYQLIHYCPWCGTRLPENLRDQWFDAIEKLGLEPEDPNIPSKYLTDEWWKIQKNI